MSAPAATAPSILSEVPRPSGRRRLDEAVARLQEGARTFARLSLDDRIRLARSMQEGYLKVAERSVRAACSAKGIVFDTPPAGEEWTAPCFVIRHLRLVQEALAALRRTGNTPIGKIGQTVDGHLAVQVFPASRIDGLRFNAVRVDVHLQPEMSEAEMHASRARFYKSPDHDGRVVLVLGAGNINAIPAMDVVTKLFNEGKVCVLKMNPVNAYLGPFLAQAFAGAIAQGFVAVVYGGVNEGEYLAHHDGIDEVHLTGSDKTFDVLVWGPPGAERELRKLQGKPLLKKPVTAELGNVSPVIVVPGPYTDTELAYQAEDVASGLLFNASFNCNAPKVVVTARGWAQREQFLGALERVLAEAAPRKAYHPGAEDRWRAFSEGRAGVRHFGTSSEEALPWTLIPRMNSDDRTERAYDTECFCPILYETQAGGPDPVEFLDRAVTFANDRLWGTLSAGLVVHPKTMQDSRLGEATERAIARLRYGAVSVNAWSGYLFAFSTPPWGAHPSSGPADIQSGRGWVHNTAMLEGIEKVVLRHPIMIKPKPVTFPSHRTAHTVMRRLTALEERASWHRLPAVLAAALRA
ncbi:MAG TPA: aldehyde dehydrogenase family protein [Gemmatimonadales bacterium]|nr:aldehyde dehydrogenase family protein [Gemmatimonadales bacterium]